MRNLAFSHSYSFRLNGKQYSLYEQNKQNKQVDMFGNIRISSRKLEQCTDAC